MKFHPSEFPGAFLIEPEPVGDARGLFRRQYCAEEFAAAGIPFEVRQTNFSENRQRHTLRGFHYRRDTLPEGKVITCIRGAVHNVVADVRLGSPTYLRTFHIELSQDNRLALFLPHGCANAFLTLQDDTMIHYLHGSLYRPGSDTGFRYDDPLFGVAWPAAPAVISEKDLAQPAFRRGDGVQAAT